MNGDDAEQLIGTREDQCTEFKAAEALERPPTIAREVVALLNATGGDIWIGVDEHEGVAVSIRGPRDPERGRQALWNHLVDTIEPSPRHDEVVTLVSPGPQGTIRVSVQNGRRKPYSLRGSRGRQFPTRIGDRIREMSLEEIGDAFRLVKADSDQIVARKAALGRELEVARPDALWWTFVPVSPFDIDLEHLDSDTKAFLQRVLMDPNESGNRPTGWTMVFDETKPEFGTARVVHRFGREPRHEVQIQNDGRMTFQAPRRRLSRNWDDKDLEVFPLALLELPASSFRMASRIFDRYGRPDADSKVLVAAQFNSFAGATLRAGSPRDPFFGSGHAKEGTFQDKTLVVEPFEVGMVDIVKTPDRVAYRLIRRFYEQFGLDEKDIPPEFDRIAGVLRFLP